MKILFVEPFSDFPVSNLGSQVGINLGLLSIAAYMRDKFKDIELDFFSMQISKVLEENVAIRDIIKKSSPDILAVTAITSSFPNAIEIIEEGKQNGCITVLGGIFPSLNHRKILENYPSVDFIILGEGEITFYHLVKSLRNKEKGNIPGLAYKIDGKLVGNEFSKRIDFSKLPPPAYDLAPIQEIKEHDIPIDLQTSRGCFANCLYCSLADLWGCEYSVRTEEQVYREIANLMDTYGVSRYRIVDDTFTLNKKRMFKLCGMLSNLDQLDLFVLTRPDMISKEFLSVMAKAGIKEILLGIETLNEDCLATINRKMKYSYENEKIFEKILIWSEEFNCTFYPTIMFGVPGEKVQNIRKTSKLFLSKLKNKKSDLMIPFLVYFTPHPGTRLHKNIKRLKLEIINYDIAKYSHFYPVSVPTTLGKDALDIMVNNYNKISIETDTMKYNPILDLDLWKKEINKNTKWDHFF